MTRHSVHSVDSLYKSIEKLLMPKLQALESDIKSIPMFNTHTDHPLHNLVKSLQIPLSRQGGPDFLMFNLPTQAHLAPPVDYEPSTSTYLSNEDLSETVHKLFAHLSQSDQRHDNGLFTTMIGTSGCGKTRTIYEYLCCRFGLYFVADTQGNGGSTDVMIAKTTIENAALLPTLFQVAQNTLDALLLTRLIVFAICLKHHPTMTPYEWLLIQTSLWTMELEQAFRLANLPSNASEPAIQDHITTFQQKHGYCLPVFVDEAQVFIGSCVDKFPSTTSGVYRPLFSKVANVFGFFRSMLTIFAGTGLGLKDARAMLLSYIGKDIWAEVHFTDFPPFQTVEEVVDYFATFVGDNITPTVRAILSQFYLGMLSPQQPSWPTKHTT